MRILLAIAAAVLVVVLLLNLRSGPAEPAAPGTEVATASEAPVATQPVPAPAVAQDSVVYLDVRTPEEYAAGHVRGTLFIPYDQVAARIAELEPYRDRDIVVYCRTGRRSGIAIQTLKGLGFTRLTNGGGLDEVVRTRNLPVETGTPAPTP